MVTEGKGNSKQKPKEREKSPRSYWSKDGQVFFTGGHCDDGCNLAEAHGTGHFE